LMPSDAYLTHSMPGRMRIRVPSKQRDPAFFRTIEEQLAKCGGVHEVRTNPLIGSVLVLYSGDPMSVVLYAQQNGLFVLAPDNQITRPVSERILERVQALDQRMRAVSDGTIDLNSAAFVALSCASIIQFLRRSVWPNGITLLWYAANTLQRYKPPNTKTQMQSSGPG
jgi:Heavy metal associated domain 2